jgi:hypothetical protein
VTGIPLTGTPAAELAALERLYLLGVGGPEDAAGVGRVEAFVWRCLVLEPRSGPPLLLLAFSAMPRLMAFTRAVNGAEPGRVPTEALRLAPDELPGDAGLGLLLDPEPEAFLALAQGGRLRELHLPQVSGPR